MKVIKQIRLGGKIHLQKFHAIECIPWLYLEILENQEPSDYANQQL